MKFAFHSLRNVAMNASNPNSLTPAQIHGTQVGLNPFSFFVETKAGAVKKKEKKKKAKGKDNRRASAGDDFDLPPPPPPLHPADKEPASLFGSAPAPAPVVRPVSWHIPWWWPVCVCML